MDFVADESEIGECFDDLYHLLLCHKYI